MKLYYSIKKNIGVFMNYYFSDENENNSCTGVMHEIKKGDTLYKLSRFYGVTLESMMESNPNVNVYNLQIGDHLCIPIQDEDINPNFTYRVQRGDTLNSLLKQFNLTFEDLLKYNQQLRPFPLEEGEVIYLPPESVIR